MLLTLIRLFRALAPIVQPLIIELVKAIKNSPDPEAAAKRALEEALRVETFDQAMRHRPPK